MKEQVYKWLIISFSKHEIVTNLYVVGSFITSYNVNDVDIVQFICYVNSMELKNHVEQIKLRQKEFQSEFNKYLHVTTFTQKEISKYNLFLNRNDKILKLI